MFNPFKRKVSPLTDKTRKQLLALPNVNGVYFGDMTKGGESRGQGLVVTVTKKLPETELQVRGIVPKSLNGFPIDVIEVGEIRLLGVDRTAEYRPFPMGVSVGHKDITAGTAGVKVKIDGDTQSEYLLSNNHVLANINKAKKGDKILQPGPYDGGNEDKVVGEVVKYIPIKFTGCSISSFLVRLLNSIAKLFGSCTNFECKNNTLKTSRVNLVDCAIAKLTPGIATPDIVELGTINGIGSVNVGEEVWKSGRSTQVKSGTVKTTNYTTQVDMGEGKLAVFTDQILISGEGFSAGGDSGSAIVVKTNQYDGLKLVGLLFAGSETVTIANKINNVFDALDIHL